MELLKPMNNITTYCDEQMQCEERKRISYKGLLRCRKL